jgi:hypothetical protein
MLLLLLLLLFSWCCCTLRILLAALALLCRILTTLEISCSVFRAAHWQAASLLLLALRAVTCCSCCRLFSWASWAALLCVACCSCSSTSCRAAAAVGQSSSPFGTLFLLQIKPSNSSRCGSLECTLQAFCSCAGAGSSEMH